jgi:hypothetical protein
MLRCRAAAAGRDRTTQQTSRPPPRSPLPQTARPAVPRPGGATIHTTTSPTTSPPTPVTDHPPARGHPRAYCTIRASAMRAFREPSARCRVLAVRTTGTPSMTQQRFRPIEATRSRRRAARRTRSCSHPDRGRSPVRRRAVGPQRMNSAPRGKRQGRLTLFNADSHATVAVIKPRPGNPRAHTRRSRVQPSARAGPRRACA